MPAEVISSGVYDRFAHRSSQAVTYQSEEQSTDFGNGQQSTLESQQMSMSKFNNAYNPYAAALGDVFGLEG